MLAGSVSDLHWFNRDPDLDLARPCQNNKKLKINKKNNKLLAAFHY
jgi:hypothetical protein